MAEEIENNDNLTPQQRAKKKLEELKGIKSKLNTESTGDNSSPKVEGEINIDEMKADISNINLHKPLVGEISEVIPEGEIIDATETIIEEIDPDKVIPKVNTPLSDKTADRGYTKIGSNATNPLEEEPVIPEPIITSQQINTEIPVTPPTDDTTGGNGTSTTSTPKPPPINSDFGDMSPSEKRKNAEKTADVILTNYAQLLPMLPKWLAKYDMGKMEMLEMKNEMRLSMIVTDDGTTIREYMESENAKADQIFVVTDAMKEEIRPALIDVLMEKDFAMTPMQRLITGLAGHALTFGVAGFKMFMEHRNAINVFKEFKERERAGDKGTSNNGGGNGDDNASPTVEHTPQNPTPQNSSNNNSNSENTSSNEEPVIIKFGDAIHNEETAIIIEEESHKKD